MDYQKAYGELMLADGPNLRERIVIVFVNQGHSPDRAIAMAGPLVDYIEGKAGPKNPSWDRKTAGIPPWIDPKNIVIKKGKRRGRPPKIETVVLAKSKRKYTKRSPHWKKK